MVEKKEIKPLQEELKGEESKGEKPKLYASMVFLGITGAGKSTLMQAIKDYVQEKDYNSREELVRTQKLGQSETQKIEEHKLTGTKQSVTIIDTPGLGDTRGPEKDKEIIEDMIQKLVKYGKFHAFCFVMKADENRETAQLKQAYLTLKYLLPKKLDNFFLCLTRSSVSQMSKVMEQIVQSLELPQKNIFFFDNRAYEKSIDDKNSKIKELKYKNSQKAILNFLNVASQLSPYESQGYKQLSKQKNKILAIIYYLNRKRNNLSKFLIPNTFHKGYKSPKDFNFIQKYLTTNYDVIDYSDESKKANQRSFIKDNTSLNCSICLDGCIAGKGNVFKVCHDNDEEAEFLNNGIEIWNDISKKAKGYFHQESTILDKIKGVGIAGGGILLSPAIAALYGYEKAVDKIFASCEFCSCPQIYHILYGYEDKYDCPDESKIHRITQDESLVLLEMIDKALKDCFEYLSQIPLIGYQYDYLQYLKSIKKKLSKVKFHRMCDQSQQFMVKHLEEIIMKEQQLLVEQGLVSQKK